MIFQVFSAEDHRSMSIFDKSDLYFYDYNLAGLFVQENYLAVTPQVSSLYVMSPFLYVSYVSYMFMFVYTFL